jgi:hypothetical protein
MRAPQLIGWEECRFSGNRSGFLKEGDHCSFGFRSGDRGAATLAGWLWWERSETPFRLEGMAPSGREVNVSCWCRQFCSCGCTTNLPSKLSSYVILFHDNKGNFVDERIRKEKLNE